jgi:hypothetical protein
MQTAKLVGLVLMFGLAGCGHHDASSGSTSPAPAAASPAASGEDQGSLWKRCMLQGEMAACREVRKNL